MCLHIVAGNPARVIRKRFDEELIQMLLALRWRDMEIEQIDSLIPLLSCSDIDRVKLEIKKML